MCIPHKRIVLFVHSHWLNWRWLATCSTIHLRTAGMRDFNFQPLVTQNDVFGPLIIQLVWYILKQFFTSVSVNWWIFTLLLRGLVNIHHHSPPLQWITIIVKYYPKISKSFFLFQVFSKSYTARVLWTGVSDLVWLHDLLCQFTVEFHKCFANFKFLQSSSHFCTAIGID